MSDAAPSDWTQVDLVGHRSAVAQKIIALVLALSAVLIVGTAFTMVPDWLAVALTIAAGILVLLIGVSLWYSVSSGNEEAERMLASGRRVDLPVRWILDTTDDAVSYRMGLRLPSPAVDPIVVEHYCGDALCIEAAQGFPGSTLPAMIDESRRVWGVLHGPIDR